MRTIAPVLPAVLLLCACQAARDGAEDTADEPVASSALDAAVDASDRGGAPAPQRLPVGEYRVAGADGADVNLPHAITVSVSADAIAVASQCVTPRWNYRYVEGRLRTEQIPDAICDRGRYPAEAALSAVFGDPQEITRTPANGIEISGGGHSVTLFSQ